MHRVFEIQALIEPAVRDAVEKRIAVRKVQNGEQLSAKHFELEKLVHHFTMFLYTAYDLKRNRPALENAINADGTLNLVTMSLIPPAPWMYGTLDEILDRRYVDPEARLIEFKEHFFGFGRDGEAKSAAEWFGAKLWKDTHLGFVWDVESAGAEIETFLRERAEAGTLPMHYMLDYLLSPVMKGMADRHRTEPAMAS